MFKYYQEITQLFNIYDKIIDFTLFKDVIYLDPPLLQRQIAIKHENQTLYNILKMVYDELVKKLFIIEKYNFDKKEFYSFEKIGFENSYSLICRNLEIENPNYNEYNNYYILINTLNTFNSEENEKIKTDFENVVNYFDKKNSILLKKTYKKYKQLFENMKLKNIFNDDELSHFTGIVEKIKLENVDI